MKKIIPLFALSLSLFACQKQPATSPDTTTSDSSAKQESFSGKITDLLDLGKDLKCTWQATDDQTTVSGLAYVSGKQTKTEMTLVNPEMSLVSYMISDGQTAYMWGDNQPGFKMTISDFEDQTDNSSSDPSYNQQNWNQDYQYDCDSWTVDPSVFTVPTNIEFTDMGQMVKDMQNNLDNVCNSLPEPQKTECLNSTQ